MPFFHALRLESFKQPSAVAVKEQAYVLLSAVCGYHHSPSILQTLYYLYVSHLFTVDQSHFF